MAFSENRNIIKWRADDGAERTEDHLALEKPLEIHLNNQPISITMRTPGHDVELVTGFLLAENIIHQKEDLLAVRNEGEDTVHAELAPGLTFNPERLERHVVSSASCGVCGRTSLDALEIQFSAIESDCVIDASVLEGLPDALKKSQEVFHQTGGLHATGLFRADGSLVVVREDVGRHNAMDKVLGYALMEGLLPLEDHILFVSGRTSFELAQKALAAAVPILAGVSAPSSMAAQVAEDLGMTLVGFVRKGRFNVYTHEKRIRF